MAFEIFDPTFEGLQGGINRATKVQSVIAQNIANANNPDYEAVEFNQELNKAVKRSNKKIVIEEEMTALSQNAIKYSAYVKLLASKINVIRTVVTQGKR